MRAICRFEGAPALIDEHDRRPCVSLAYERIDITLARTASPSREIDACRAERLWGNRYSRADIAAYGRVDWRQ